MPNVGEFSWGPDSSLERERKIRRLLHRRAVTAKKCTQNCQKCDARAKIKRRRRC